MVSMGWNTHCYSCLTWSRELSQKDLAVFDSFREVGGGFATERCVWTDSTGASGLFVGLIHSKPVNRGCAQAHQGARLE